MLEEATQFEHQQYILYQRADSEGKSACPPGRLTSDSHTHEKSQKLELAVTSVIPASQSVVRREAGMQVSCSLAS